MIRDYESTNISLNSIRNINDWLPDWSGWLKPSRKDAPEIPADLEVEQSGVCFVDGPRRAGLPVVPAARSRRRAGVCRLPRCAAAAAHLPPPGSAFRSGSAAEDAHRLARVCTVRRSASCTWRPASSINQQPPVGIVQCYGVSAFAPTLEEACAQSRCAAWRRSKPR